MDLIINTAASLWLLFFGAEVEGISPKYGSRGLVVTNHHAKSDILQVSLRNCQCGSFEHNPLEFCPCWANFLPVDQPAVQGDPRIFVYYFLRPLFPQFDFVTDDGFGLGHEFSQLSLYIPSPEKLSLILKEIGLDRHFEFVKGSSLVSPEVFLGLIAQGKTPIANIKHEARSPELVYQDYFHDIFNHFFIWAYMPDDIRNLIIKRADLLLDFSRIIENKIKDNEHLMSIWQLVLSRIATKFDESIGTLNNALFMAHLKSTCNVDNCGLNTDIYRSPLTLEQIRFCLESTINLGHYLSVEREDMMVMTFMDEKWFIKKLIDYTVGRFQYIKNQYLPGNIRMISLEQRVSYINQLIGIVDEIIVVDKGVETIESTYIDVDTFMRQLSDNIKQLKELHSRK